MTGNNPHEFRNRSPLRSFVTTKLEKILLLRPTPVIIVTGLAQEGNDVTARAFTLGAIACYATASKSGSIANDDGGKLAAVICQAAQVHFDERSLGSPAHGI
jgi:two-component system chemotaxis response regulator CheB